jgi:hypothetical protein
MLLICACAMPTWACSEALDTEGNNAPGGDDPSPSEPGEAIPDDCVPDYECTPNAPDTGDFYADCVSQVNQFRACVCLPPLTRNREAEGCLDQQAEYDASEGPHAGFQADLCAPRGNAQNECPAWRDARQVVEGCLQQMFDEGPPPSASCEGDCFQQHGHFLNMTNTDYSQVACGLYVAQGEVWSVQNFF